MEYCKNLTLKELCYPKSVDINKLLTEEKYYELTFELLYGL